MLLLVVSFGFFADPPPPPPAAAVELFKVLDRVLRFRGEFSFFSLNTFDSEFDFRGPIYKY